ncbi:unnamed protein product, partial [Rotaria sordida]
STGQGTITIIDIGCVLAMINVSDL